MLSVEADKHNGGALQQAENGAGALGYPERVELLAGDRFDHAVQFLEIEAGMGPELGKLKLLEEQQHFCRSLSHRQFGGHNRVVEGRPSSRTSRSRASPALMPELGGSVILRRESV